MSDLIERLRHVESTTEWPGTNSSITTNWLRNPDGLEAADELERLRRELAEAQTAIANWKWIADQRSEKLDEARGLLSEAREEMSAQYDAEDAMAFILRIDAFLAGDQS